MNLVRLGTAQRSLFALHDPAVPGAARSRAAVICNPLGMEQIYAHRALRQLALRLSRCGLDTLRFDYFGTGDSDGDDADVNTAGMLSDVEFAIEAARDIAGVRKVVLIGLRNGADVAAQVALRQPADIESLVLWDPVESAALSPELRARSLVIATQNAAASDDAESILAPCCWVESIATSGALPLSVFQRIEEWLR